MTQFAWVTCQPGAEALVKRDLQRRSPHLRLAFSRPGFLTLKSDTPLRLDLDRPTVFARAWGVSLGRATTLADALAVGEAGEGDLVHVFQRDDRPLDELTADPWAAERQLAAAVAELGVVTDRPPRPGERVVDIVLVDVGQFWVGAHQHSATHRPTAGGRPPQFTAPPGAPSRVWGKISEALWRTGLDVNARSHILDIGCAPGGGTLVLLQRGARVVGVDPADMAPVVADHPHFEHRRVAFELLDPDTLPDDLDIFVYDVNLSPKMMLGDLAALLRGLPSLRHGLVTLKLNKPEHVDHVDAMLHKLRAAGFTHLTTEQLFHNRQELFVHAQK